MESLRKALAMGADRAVLVSDEAAAGSDLLATSYILAARARAGEPRSRPLRPAVERRRRGSDVGGGRRSARPTTRLPGRGADASKDRHSPESGRPSSGTTSFERRSRPWSRCPTRSTRRGIHPSRGSWARNRSRRRSLGLADVGVDADRVGQPGSRTVVLATDAATTQERPGQARGRRVGRGEDRRVPRREEAHLMTALVFLEHHEGDARQGWARRAGARAGARSGGRRSRARTRRRRRRRCGRCVGREKVFVVDDPVLATPLPQPRVDAMEAVVAAERRGHRPLRRLGALRRRRRRARRATRGGPQLGPRRSRAAGRRAGRQATSAWRLGAGRRRLDDAPRDSRSSGRARSIRS